MKRFLVICVLLVAGLGFAQEAKAQYAGPITRQDANLVDQSGHVLTDSEIIALVGNDIYEETVVGARRQLQAGKGLIIGGAASIGAGLVFAVFSGVEMAKSKAADIRARVPKMEPVTSDDFDLSDISHKEKSREDIIAEAEAAAFSEA